MKIMNVGNGNFMVVGINILCQDAFKREKRPPSFSEGRSIDVCGLDSPGR